jgi:hypothetical protein
VTGSGQGEKAAEMVRSAQHLEDRPVTSMREFVSEVLAEAEDLKAELDRRLDERISQLREKLRALDVAEDPELQADVQELLGRVETGEPLGPEVDLHDLRRRHVPTAQ